MMREPRIIPGILAGTTDTKISGTSRYVHACNAVVHSFYRQPSILVLYSHPPCTKHGQYEYSRHTRWVVLMVDSSMLNSPIVAKDLDFLREIPKTSASTAVAYVPLMRQWRYPASCSSSSFAPLPNRASETTALIYSYQTT